MSADLSIRLGNFRAFPDTGRVNIRPLTFLVGENSTGKTSFLSALRFCFNLSDRQKTGYFNVPPFDLGSYEDIVHQSGHSSTTQRFSINIEKLVDVARDGSMFIDPNAESDLKQCRMTIFFGSRYGEVSLSSLEFYVDDIEVLYRAQDKGQISLKKGGEEVPRPPNQASFPFNERIDTRPEDLQSILYRLIDQYLAWVHSSNETDTHTTVRRCIEAFDAFISAGHLLHSSPPVRSVPRRVYTSSDEGSFGDQTHAPQELNRLKRADRRRWGRLRTGLTNFGKMTGLFTKFDITKLTRQDAGPFQLKVTVRGRSSNVADVGYGVSQALPIMTDIIESPSDRSAFLFQQPEVHLHPKAQAALGTIFSEYISANSKSYIIAETHSDYLIDRVRIQVRKGVVPSQLVGILYFESLENEVVVHEITCDKLGNLVGAPAGYRQFFIAEQEEVLGL